MNTRLEEIDKKLDLFAERLVRLKAKEDELNVKRGVLLKEIAESQWVINEKSCEKDQLGDDLKVIETDLDEIDTFIEAVQSALSDNNPVKKEALIRRYQFGFNWQSRNKSYSEPTKQADDSESSPHYSSFFDGADQMAGSFDAKKKDTSIT